MNKNVFKSYISESNFREMFIREMGWNNPKGQTDFDIVTDDVTYELKQIAERSGFQVLTCQVDEIPTSSLCKKIDSRLRRYANDYICIFHISRSEHHLWVVPVKKVEKRDLVLVEYASADKAEFLFDKIERISFELDEHTTIVDVKERIQEGFIINSEKITKDFYTEFRKEHKNFTNFISGIDDYIDEENKKRPKDKQIENKNKQWYTSVMLNRLMFCYFIQKKKFLDLNVNYLRDKLTLVQHQRSGKFYTFYRGFLRSLFHDGLNSPRHERDFQQKYGRIPYLNGGMFDEHELEKNYPNIDIADEAFESLFAFFDQWHWHLDDRLTASGKDINPDVLGYIFEQYINDRAKMGAYYTKEDITEYIGKNCILPFLMDKVRTATKDSEKYFRPNGYVWQTLAQSGDSYIYDAVKKGYSDDWQEQIPDYIAQGINTSEPNLLERRSRWNERTSEAFALPTEIWRETIERLQRCSSLLEKIYAGDIAEINDFITYNLNIRQFVYDLLLNADDHHFVAHFYHAMQKVTILDPTCGSGAFLFAAMNILEPLYEVCIDRMQEWNAENPKLFEEELHELNVKYRSNIRYFIYKSIILRNLYGVDIMVEATEIAKLRLFLKMVAVVDVNPRDNNLGLEPLPDVDFNIRCGNTLVGYATEKEIIDGIQYTDFFAQQEFEAKVKTEMIKVAKAYKEFKIVQLEQDSNLQVYKDAKKDLNERLKVLNELLNQNYHKATNPDMDYNNWKASHQPFHWLAEYYDIVNGNGGFNVIIGNPPYVEKTTINYNICFTQSCYSNLYAYCLERCKMISNISSYEGLIVPMSITSIREYGQLRTFIKNTYSSIYLTNHAIRPISLFTGVSQRVSITILSNNTNDFILKTTNYLRTRDRSILFKTIKYYDGTYESNRDQLLPKIGDFLLKKIYDKIHLKSKDVMTYKALNSSSLLYFKDYGETYWIFPFNFNPCLTPVKSFKSMMFKKDIIDKVFVALNSSLFYIFYTIISDCWHLGVWHLGEFPISIDTVDSSKSKDLSKSMKYNRITRFDKRAGGNIYEYKIYKSKPIIDEIDKILAKHYGFTDEELDFIINYDIKYRMGDELNED